MVKQISIKFSVMRFIAQSNTSSSSTSCDDTTPDVQNLDQTLLQNEMYILHCLLTRFIALRGSELAMRFLLSACFCKVCACVADALRLAMHILLTICSCHSLAGSLSSFTHTISKDSNYIFLIIWYLYLPVVWEFITTVTAHRTLTTALH